MTPTSVVKSFMIPLRTSHIVSLICLRVKGYHLLILETNHLLNANLAHSGNTFLTGQRGLTIISGDTDNMTTHLASILLNINMTIRTGTLTQNLS